MAADAARPGGIAGLYRMELDRRKTIFILLAAIFLLGGCGTTPPRILERLRRPDFLSAIADKGRFSDFCSGLPVHVILDPKAALHGAAWFGMDALAARVDPA